MKALKGVRVNTVHAMQSVDGKEEMRPLHELIFLIDDSSYALSNDGEIVRTRTLEKFSFFIEHDNIPQLIKTLQSIND